MISLYSGAGGLDYGFEAAGFKTRVAVEINPDCCDTLRANRKWAVIEDSIHNVTAERILEAGKLKVGEAHVLIGGPPCQPFSKAGYWARGDSKRLDDPRAATLNAYMRIVEETQPKAFLLENVEGLSYAGKNEGLEFLVNFVNEINKRTGSNYAPEFKVVKAVDYGVPQLRNRFFMIAARDGQKFEFPDPTHRKVDPDNPELMFENLPAYRTAWHALADVGPAPGEELGMRGKWSALLPSIPEGSNYLWHTDRGGGLPLFGWRRRYWSFLLKLSKNLPSWTIQAQPGPAIGPFHWDNRRLSMREMCRLQTFPDDVVIQGGRTAIQKQLGNAVPSLLAETLAREIRVQIFGRGRYRSPRKLLPPNVGNPPRAGNPKPVAAQFLELVGEHSAHPGTGKGFGSQARRAEAEFTMPETANGAS